MEYESSSRGGGLADVGVVAVGAASRRRTDFGLNIEDLKYFLPWTNPNENDKKGGKRSPFLALNPLMKGALLSRYLAGLM